MAAGYQNFIICIEMPMLLLPALTRLPAGVLGEGRSSPGVQGPWPGEACWTRLENLGMLRALRQPNHVPHLHLVGRRQQPQGGTSPQQWLSPPTQSQEETRGRDQAK